MSIVTPDLVTGLDWNPSFPEQVGVERIDAGYDAAVVNSAGTAHALTFVAQHTGPVAAVELYGHNTTSQLGEQFYYRYRPMVAELYEGTDIYFGSEQPPFLAGTFVAPAQPTAIQASASLTNENRTAANVNRITTFNDNLWLQANALNPYFRAWFDLGNWPLDRRVLNVRLVVRANANIEIARVDPDGTAMWRRTQAIATGTITDYDLRLGEILVDNVSNPDWTGWTPTILREFAPGGPRHWFFRARAAAGRWAVRGVRIEVIWCPETRIAVGYQYPETGYAWTRFTLRRPDGTPGHAVLQAGQTYPLLLRRPFPDNAFAVASASFNWRHIRGRIGDGTWQSYPVALRGREVHGSSFTTPSQPAPEVVIPPPVTDHAMCAQFLDEADEITDTAQPYVLARGVPLWSDPDPSDPNGPTRLPRRITQIIDIKGAAVATTYGMTSVVLGWRPGSPPRDEAEVEVSVYPLDEATPILPSSTLTFGAIRRTPIVQRHPTGEGNFTYRLVRFRHDPGVPLPEGRYRVVVQTYDVNAVRPLYVESLIGGERAGRCGAGYMPVEEQTWDGVDSHAQGIWPSEAGSQYLTGTGNPNAAPAMISSDAQITLGYVPPKIENLIATDADLDAHTLVCCELAAANGDEYEGCAAGMHNHPCTCEEATGVPYVALRWAEAIDRETAYYEIQRSDAYEPEWITVAIRRGIINNHWDDFEARVGVPTHYRVRAVRPSEVAGDWSDVTTITAATSRTERVALSFTSNVDLQLLGFRLACAYPEIYDGEVERDFTFQEYDEVEFVPIHGRQRQVAFHRVERLGVQFRRNVMLSAICAASRPSMEMYDPLRVISWAALPYVCVRDGDGNRWFANVQVPTATNQRSDVGDFWFAEVLVTEVATYPHLQDLPFSMIPQNLLPSDDMAGF